MARGVAAIIVLAFVVSLVPLLQSSSTQVQAAGLPFPRIGVVYYDSPYKNLDALARYDLWVGANDTSAHDALKARNPNLKFIAYQISTESCSSTEVRNNIGNLAPGFSDRWWLRSHTGVQYTFWANCPMANQSAASPVVNGLRFNQFFANYVRDYLWNPAGGKYDGIYFDNAWEGIAWAAADYGNSIDLDRNGVNDFSEHGQAWVDQQWGDGYRQMMQQVREFVGPDAILMGGSALTMSSANGRIWEDWPTGWDYKYSPTYGNNSWRAAFENYRDWQRNHYPGDFAYLILTYPKSQGDYSGVRYGLASALLGDGYFSSAANYGDHTNLWWYDEYSVDYATGRATGDASKKGYLGYPKGDPREVQPGVWRRDFDNGLAIVNTTGSNQTVALGGSYRKIRGTQDPAVNNGQTVSSVTLGPNDGIILLTTGEQVVSQPSDPTPPPAVAPAPTPAPTPAPNGNQVSRGPNLIKNPGFEEGTTGWSTWQGNLSTVSGGRSGNAAKVSGASTTFTLSNWPGAVPNPQPGQTYAATAWVKGEGSSIGKQVALVLREHNDDASSQDAAYGNRVTLTGDWQQLSVQKTITGSGMTNVDVLVEVTGAANDVVYVDDASMWQGTLNEQSASAVLPNKTSLPVILR